MALRLVLAAALLLPVMGVMEDYLLDHKRTTSLFRECEEQLYRFEGEPYLLDSEWGCEYVRFAPERKRNLKWDEVAVKRPRTLLKCFAADFIKYGGNSTLVKYDGNRCYRTADEKSYEEEETPQHCGDSPPEVVYFLYC